MILSFAWYLRCRAVDLIFRFSKRVAIIGVQTVVFAFGILQGHARLTMHATIRKSFMASHHGSSQGQKLRAEDPDREDSYGEAEVSSCILCKCLATSIGLHATTDGSCACSKATFRPLRV
jgi:hypothetical protein